MRLYKENDRIMIEFKTMSRNIVVMEESEWIMKSEFLMRVGPQTDYYKRLHKQYLIIKALMRKL